MTERLYQNYKNNIANLLHKKFNYKNVMEIPKIDKVVINMGVGEAVKDTKKIEIAQKELSSIMCSMTSDDHTKSNSPKNHSPLKSLVINLNSFCLNLDALI